MTTDQTTVNKPVHLPTAADFFTPEQIASFVQDGLWRDKQITDFLHENAVHRADEVAVVDRFGRSTWRELEEKTRRLAAFLADLDLDVGDFVGIQMPNWTDGVAAFLAVQLAGYRPLTMLPIYRDADVAFMLRKCGARVLIIPESYRKFDYPAMVERIRSEVPALEHVIVHGVGAGGFESWTSSGRVPEHREFAGRRLDPRGVGRVAFTSGTTAKPKGVMHGHNTDMTPPTWVSRALGQGPGDPILVASPIMHVTGMIFGIYQSLLVGCKMVLQDVWNPADALDLIENERIFTLTAAATFISDLIHEPTVGSRDLSSFRYLVQGGAPTPPDLVQRAYDILGVTVLKTFAQSEAPVHNMNRPDDPWEKVLSTDGRILPGARMKVVDPSDRRRTCEPGEPGEYSTWGPHVFFGYFDDPARTAEARDHQAWFYSGDLCSIDSDGHVRYVDRIKDIINRGAIKLSALEIEEYALSHPSVRAAAAVPMADPRLGERVCLYVILEPGATLTLEELVAHFRSNGVTTQKWPERLEILESFPLTATGKVRKNVLRDALDNREILTEEVDPR